MSANPGLQPGADLLHYRLVSKVAESITGTVWKAEDSKQKRVVALKVFSSDLPIDRTRVAQQVRAAAALRHSGIAAVYEAAADGPHFFIVREFAEGEPLWKILKDRPLDRMRFFYLAVQIAQALAYAHAHGLVHGNLRSDNVIVDPRSGRVKLAGFGVPKQPLRTASGQITLEAFSYLSVREAAFLAPEQLTGTELHPRMDVFACGLVLYHMATGKLAFSGTTSVDVLTKIVREQPANPAALNPSLSAGLIAFIGRSIHKDPQKRYAAAEQLLADIKREGGMQEMEDPESATLKGDGVALRQAVVLVAALPSVTGPNTSTSLLQQIVGEQVFAVDGKVPDAFSEVVVAELPDAERAIDAAKKSRLDVEAHNRANPSEQLEARFAIHIGMIEEQEEILTGPAVDLALGAARAARSLQVVISEDALAQAALPGELRVVQIFSGVKFSEIRAVETRKPEPAQRVVPEDVGAEAVAEEKKQSKAVPFAMAAGLAIAAGIVGFVFLRPQAPPPAGNTPAAVARPQITTVSIDGVHSELDDPVLEKRGEAVLRAVLRIARNLRGVTVVDGDATAVFSAALRRGPTGVEFIPRRLSGRTVIDGAPAPMNGSGEAAKAMLEWVVQQTGAQKAAGTTSDPRALHEFVEAIAAAESNDTAAAVASLRRAVEADHSFLAAHLFAAELFAGRDELPEAVRSAEAVAQLDPRNTENLRQLGRWNIELAQPADAITAYARILQIDGKDKESLQVLARYALSAGDAARFDRIMRRLGPLKTTSFVHQPDIVAASGSLDRAATRYYDAEVADPKNPSLVFKVGRMAALRHADSVVDLEIGKLETLDARYGLPMLSAYAAANAGDARRAEESLQTALAAASWRDEPYTHAAEIYAILGQPAKCVAAIEKAVERGEPSLSYIANHPLFRFLASDARFSRMLTRIDEEKTKLNSHLASAGV